jgi:hypothetical protein
MEAANVSERFVTPVRLYAINILQVYSASQIKCGI